jgi:hypothetical protein
MEVSFGPRQRHCSSPVIFVVRVNTCQTRNTEILHCYEHTHKEILGWKLFTLGLGESRDSKELTLR